MGNRKKGHNNKIKHDFRRPVLRDSLNRKLEGKRLKNGKVMVGCKK